MLYSSKTYRVTDNTETFPVTQAKAKKLIWIRQNKILKVVYGVLYLTPKAGVWLRRGDFSWQQMKSRWIPV